MDGGHLTRNIVQRLIGYFESCSIGIAHHEVNMFVDEDLAMEKHRLMSRLEGWHHLLMTL